MQHWVRTVLEDAIWQGKTVSGATKEGLDRIVQLIEHNDVHTFRTDELERLSDDLSECGDLTDLSELMWQVATSVGFQNFTIFVLRQGSGGTFKSRICTSYNEAWIARYQEQSYQYIDPVIARSAGEDGWFLFSDLENSAPAVIAFWDEAERFRVGRNGLCFAMTRLDGTRIGVSFATMNTDAKVREIVRLNGADLEFLAHQAADCFCFASFGPSLSDDTLSLEELRFLHILSSSPNPDDALKISPSYGSNKALQASIRSKLNVETVFQAVVIAASKGWFNQLPYDPGEVMKPFRALEGLRLGEPLLDVVDTLAAEETPEAAPVVSEAPEEPQS